MHITILYETGVPIYEQIKTQIREEILRGGLNEGEMLPSIRTLAKELKIGIVTAKRAYDDLCAEGFLYSLQGKGVFVARLEGDIADNYAVNEIREKFLEIASFAERNSVGSEKLKQLYNQIFGDK